MSQVPKTEGARCGKIIYIKTYCDASTKANDPIAECKKKIPMCFLSRRKNYVCGHWHDCSV